MKTALISHACLVAVGLLSASLLAGCAAPAPESAEDPGVAAEPVTLPTETYSSMNSTTRLYSFKIKLTVKGELEVDGVGVSDTVDLYTTPTISVPF